MIGRVAVWLAEYVLCFVAHRTSWIPVWNQSTFLTCPTLWLINRSSRFETWHERSLAHKAVRIRQREMKRR